jgi:hypothetical protein
MRDSEAALASLFDNTMKVIKVFEDKLKNGGL